MGKINKKIIVSGTKVSIVSKDGQDYLSLTEMLKAKDGDFFISDWLRNRNTVEFLGIWESINNPDFNYGEFATIKSQAGLNSFKISAKEWRDKNKDKQGNVRDYATVEQLVVLINLESLNAQYITEGISQPIRLPKLNEIAISQMKSLINNPSVRKLEIK